MSYQYSCTSIADVKQWPNCEPAFDFGILCAALLASPLQANPAHAPLAPSLYGSPASLPNVLGGVHFPCALDPSGQRAVCPHAD